MSHCKNLSGQKNFIRNNVHCLIKVVSDMLICDKFYITTHLDFSFCFHALFTEVHLENITYENNAQAESLKCKLLKVYQCANYGHRCKLLKMQTCCLFKSLVLGSGCVLGYKTELGCQGHIVIVKVCIKCEWLHLICIFTFLQN